MNQRAMACPTQEHLTGFSAGKLNVTESTEIEQHLAECPSCCQLLKMLPDDNTLVSLLRDPKVETRSESEHGHPVPSEAATLPPKAEQVTMPPGDGATEFAEASSADVASSLPEPLRDHSRYRITQILGRGGMGDVYKAHHRMMNRPVALKVINGQLVNSHAAIQRFHREVQAAARLAHRNIVTAYDAEQAGDAHFLVMEFVEGTDLAALVRQRGPLPVAEACDYIRQAAEGLQHAHELGMVHRDIKPQNLMVVGQASSLPRGADGKLEAYPTVKILDFGLANFATETAVEQAEQTTDAQHSATLPAHLTMMGSMMGTPDYISPEQAHDAHSADIRSDIYSLGCTLYCLLTGEPPFTGDSVLDKVMAHVEREPEPLSDHRDDVSPELAAVVTRMMAKDPAERFQTPAEVAAALAPFAKPVAQPPRRRSRTLVAAALAGLVVLLAGVIVVAMGRGRLEIQSEVDDVQVSVEQGGEQVAILDLKTGSQVKWLPTGSYELKLVGGENDITLDQRRLTMSRLGKVIVTARWNTEGRGTLGSFNPPAEPITQDGVEVADGGWKITAADTRTARLFEAPLPPLAAGPFFYRAKLKTENVKGRAFLEMWVRFPGQGEFFSKGFHNAVSGTNGWAEYEIPFFLKKGQQPDLAKLNLTIEGSGTVWIKDIQLRGRQTVPVERPGAEVKTGNLIANSGFEESVDANGRYPADWMAERTTLATEPEADCYRDTETKYRGTASGAVVKRQSNSDAPEAGFVQRITGLPTGQNLRLSGHLKSKDLQGAAYIVLRMINPGRGPVPVAWCATPLVQGTTDWQRYEAYIRTPDAGDAMLALVMRGKGTVWFDEISLEVAPKQTEAAAVDSDQPVARLGPDARLQGKWVPVSASFRGKSLTDEQLARLSITLTGDRAELTDPDSGQAMTGTFTIDASRSPKHIDFIAPDGKERAPGIFEFDGDRLKIVLVDGDYARPTDFEPAETPDHMTGVFERVPGSAPVTLPQDEPIAVPALDEEQQAVVKAAEAYLAVMDEGRFGSLRDMVSSLAKQHVTREQVSQTYQKLRDTFGKATHRTLNRVQVYDEFPGLPAGRYAGVQYKTDFERQKGLWESLLLNVDTDGQWRVNTYANTLEPMPFPETKRNPVIEQKLQTATSAAQDWLKLVDAGKYGESWDASAKINRDGISKDKMIDAYKQLFQPLGAMQSREFKSSEYKTQLPQALVGEYAVIQFTTQFTKGRVLETVILMREPDGPWHVAGYRHAEDNSPPTPPPATSKPPQRKTGLLTNPPKLPPEGVPVGRNLIVDPSLEETPTGQLPQGWFAWLDDGPDFKCEVVEGGVTGKHCLQISGTGTRGVVFATSIPLDRTKRYALKGRVKVEGEAGTWAVIKLNYFNSTGWLGVDDRVGVPSSDLDWKFFEKTDLAEKYPGATLIVPTCHIEGNGTAWFDDLEVIAYDREKLPNNFDATHGRNNRMK